MFNINTCSGNGFPMSTAERYEAQSESRKRNVPKTGTWFGIRRIHFRSLANV